MKNVRLPPAQDLADAGGRRFAGQFLIFLADLIQCHRQQFDRTRFSFGFNWLAFA